MTIATTIKHFLEKNSVSYQIKHHIRTDLLEDAADVTGVPRYQVARATLLKDEYGVMMAVVPASHRVDVSKLAQLLRRNLILLTDREANPLFFDCEPGTCPPLADPYGLTAILDASLLECHSIYFEPGTHHALLQLARSDFKFLMTYALKGYVAKPNIIGVPVRRVATANQLASAPLIPSSC